MLSALNSEKLSAQSPPCNRKASPSEAFASEFLSDLTSPAKTKGGKSLKEVSTLSRCFWFLYSGRCLAL